jgi:hypothetical protein
MYTASQYYKVKHENDALTHHYNNLVNVLNDIYKEQQTSAPEPSYSQNSSPEPPSNSNIVELLKKQNATLTRELINKNKEIVFLKSAKYAYQSSPRSVSSLHVDQFSDISEWSMQD